MIFLGKVVAFPPDPKNPSKMPDSDPTEIEIEIDFGDFEEEAEESSTSAEEPPVEAAAENEEAVSGEPPQVEEEVAEAPADEPEEEEEEEPPTDPGGTPEAIEQAAAEIASEAEPERPVAGDPLPAIPEVSEELSAFDEIAMAIAAATGEPLTKPGGDSKSDGDEMVTTLKGSLAEPVAPTAPPRSTITSAHNLNFRSVGIKNWKVKVKIGLVYDFSDIKTLQKYIKDGRVTNEDTISYNGKEWTTIGDIPDLEQHFINVYLQAEASMPTTPVEKRSSPLAMEGGASSLTDGLLQQITDESVAAVEAGTALTGPEFVDPFAEMKKKQNTRIKQRNDIRSMSREAKESEKSGGMKKLGLLGLLVAIAVFVLIPKGETPVEAPATTSLTPPAPEPEANPNSASLDEMRASISSRLEAVQTEASEAMAEPEPEQRTYITPDMEVERPEQPAASSGGTTSTARQTTSAAPVNRGPPSARARRAYAERDYAAAKEAYTQAFNVSRDPQMVLGLGKSLFHLGEQRQAEQKLLAAEQAGVIDGEGLRMLIRIYESQGDQIGASTYQQKLQRLGGR